MDRIPRTYQESIEIAASPEAVYTLVTDIARTARPVSRYANRTPSRPGNQETSMMCPILGQTAFARYARR